MNAEQIRERSLQRRREVMNEASARTPMDSLKPLLLEIACAVHQWGGEQAAILAEMRDAGNLPLTTADLAKLGGALRCRQCHEALPLTVGCLRAYLEGRAMCPYCRVENLIEWQQEPSVSERVA